MYVYSDMNGDDDDSSNLIRMKTRLHNVVTNNILAVSKFGNIKHFFET